MGRLQALLRAVRRAATKTAVADSRERWKVYKVAGHTLVYWQQTAAGGWEKKA